MKQLMSVIVVALVSLAFSIPAEARGLPSPRTVIKKTHRAVRNFLMEERIRIEAPIYIATPRIYVRTRSHGSRVRFYGETPNYNYGGSSCSTCSSGYRPIGTYQGRTKCVPWGSGNFSRY